MTTKYLELFIRLFYPAACETCHKPLRLEERTLCAGCHANLLALVWPTGEALVDGPFEYLDQAWAVFAYDSPLKELLHSVKYHRKDYILNAVLSPASALAQAVTADIVYDAMIPVPIDRRKYMRRHFNQSEVIARLIRPFTSLPVRTGLLKKAHPIPSQTSLNHEERAINVYGAFKAKNTRKIRGRSFLLIDDVFTTGATANEAARTLKDAGAKRVDLFALSRTVIKA
jgi:ComF family protein